MAPERGPQLRAFLIGMMVISIVAVALRFWSRMISKRRPGQRSKYGWDDWLALLSLPTTIVNLSLAIYLIAIGIGKNIEEVSAENRRKVFHNFFIMNAFYQLSVTFPKFSALFFYSRIFGTTSRLFRYTLWTTHGLIWAWNIALWSFSIFLCDPIQKQWISTLPGHCHSLGALWLVSAVPNLVIDLIILLIPMPMLWPLQMKKSRKAGVIAVFFCGYCIIIISAGRLVVVSRSVSALTENFTWNAVPTIYWSTAEAPIAILGISLPSILLLIRRLVRDGPASLFTARVEHGAEIPRNSHPYPSADHRNAQNKVGLGRHGLDRQSFSSANNILILDPRDQEYRVHITKSSTNGSLCQEGVAEEYIRVRNEVRVDSANVV